MQELKLNLGIIVTMQKSGKEKYDLDQNEETISSVGETEKECFLLQENYSIFHLLGS